MWDSHILDTRELGDAAALMDGFVHVLPMSSIIHHWVQIDCWCEPVVVWPKDGQTLIVYHRHLRIPGHV